MGRVLAQVRRQRAGVAAGAFVLLLVLVAILVPHLVPFDPENYFDYDALNAGPSARHWFGVDSLGRDVLSRIVMGARISLAAGFFPVAIGAVVGAVMGLVAGYYEGWWDRLFMRICDVLFAFPGHSAGDRRGRRPRQRHDQCDLCRRYLQHTGICAAGARQCTFTQASHLRRSSAEHRSIQLHDYFRHIFPGTISSMVVYFTMRIGTSIITAASLSFLGMGAQPPTPSGAQC